MRMQMKTSRREFIGGLSAGAAFAAMPSFAAELKAERKCRIGVQRWSLNGYVPKVGFAKAMEELAKIGYEGVEFYSYYKLPAKEIKKILDDNGLVACGTHVGRWDFDPANYEKTCEFCRECGITALTCPRPGNYPPPKGTTLDDWMKTLCEKYNVAAENCAKYGCTVGLHNHMNEFKMKLSDGTLFWDAFFKGTDSRVQMQQDVGWTVAAGFDPCEQYEKYPHRSYSLHAKENGEGKNVKKFTGILGRPGEGDPGAKGVDWDRLFKATDADGVKWYIVECERSWGSLDAVKPSFEFLRSKGRV